MSSSANNYVLLIHCSDEKGIVHKVTGVLYEQELNVEEQAEFVDKAEKHFFMRTVVSGDVEPETVLSRVKACVPASASVELFEERPKDVVIFVSKEPHCLGDLLIRHAFGEIKARVLAVIGNHADLETLTSRFEIPFHLVEHRGKERPKHEAEILEVLERYNPEYLVLAKYMRVLSAGFIARYRYRIINIHHSFLPAFVGAHPYRQAYERGVKIIGATAHFAIEDLDQGPIIAQDVVPIDHSKDPSDMMRSGRNVETSVLANALRLVFEDRVFVHKNRTIVFD